MFNSHALPGNDLGQCKWLFRDVPNTVQWGYFLFILEISKNRSEKLSASVTDPFKESNNAFQEGLTLYGESSLPIDPATENRVDPFEVQFTCCKHCTGFIFRVNLN